MSLFEPLDMGQAINQGTKNTQTKKVYLWAFRHDDPESTGLKDLPSGESRFWGIPFRIAEREEDPESPAFVMVASGVSGLPDKASIPVGRAARRVIFAHCSGPSENVTASLEGTGEPLGLESFEGPQRKSQQGYSQSE